MIKARREDIIMNSALISVAVHRLRKSAPAVSTILGLILLFQPALILVANAQARSPRGAKQQTMTEDQRIAHVLSRLTFGAHPGDFERVKAAGVDVFISQQLDPDSMDDAALQAKLAKLPTLGMATPVIIAQYTPPKPAPVPSPGPAKAADNAPTPAQSAATPAPAAINPNSTATSANIKMTAEKPGADKTSALPAGESMKAPDAAQKATDPQKPGGPQSAAAAPKPTPPPKNPQMVVAELQRAALLRAVYSERQLNELMVEFWENHFSIFANKDDDRFLMTSFDRDTVRPFVFGRFRDLLGATAHSPAMLYYLDNWRSSVARPYPATKDKPAGVDGGINENYARELLELHTMGVDGGYTQKDVQEVARCFTGWTIEKPNEEGLFLYRPGFHDKGEKIILGHRIPAGGGIDDAERVLDILATHPATAHFIATKLARRFISDDPPPSVIDRAAEVFLKTDGSIRETLRAIVTSPEFFAKGSYRAKMRSPLEYVAAAIRAVGAETDGDRQVLDAIARMGQPVFEKLTPDGYRDRADQWLSSGAMLQRFNFASALAFNRIRGTKFDSARLLSGVDQANKPAVETQLVRLTIFSDASSATRAALEKALLTDSVVSPVSSATSPTAGVPARYGANGAQASAVTTPKPAYIPELITLLIGSPEFQQR